MSVAAPVVVTPVRLIPVPKVPTCIAACACREWIAPIGYGPGRCGLCGELAYYVRADPASPEG